MLTRGRGALLSTAPVAAVRFDFDREGITGTHAVGLADPRTGRAIMPDDLQA